MRQARVRRDVDTVKNHSTVVGWQEIKYARYKRALRRVGDCHWQHAQLDSPIPISVNSDHYTILRSGKQRTHKGRAGASPARYFSYAVIKVNATGELFMVVNTHYVSGAWNHKRKLFKRWRKRMWEAHHEELRQFVNACHDGGITILGTGDYNRVHVSRFHPNQEWLRNGGIDKLWYLEGAQGPQIRQRGETIARNLESDHHLRTARIRLR